MPDSSYDIFTITAPGLEPVTLAELQSLGAVARVTGAGGVSWRGNARALYDANLRLRTASRIVVRIAQFHAASFHELERRAKRVPWERFAGAETGVTFRVTCRKSALYHSDAVAARLCESVERATGAHCGIAADDSPVDEAAADDVVAARSQMFVVRVDHDTVTISADSSGALLHRRGYRRAVAKAPLRETLAAAMVLASGWTPALALCDPMCGSGTIGIEAALLARRMAPGRARGFAFEHWPEAAPDEWQRVRDRAAAEELTAAPAPILLSDRDAGAVDATLANGERAGVVGDLAVRRAALSEISPIPGVGWLVTNPPYGVRLGTDVRNLYGRLGAILRERLPEWRLAMLSASPVLERQLRLPLENVFSTSNGGIRVRLVRQRAEPRLSASEVENAVE